jgi:hypothetical protein
MANAFVVETPRMAHELASAMGKDAANNQMRKAGRDKWNRADYNLCCETVQRWYANFGILSAEQWMPEGYEWRKVRGDWQPVARTMRRAA